LPPLPRVAATTALDHALAFADIGWPAFPCSPQTKAPLVVRGLYSASTDVATIHRWWRQWPDAMIGLPTGSPTGVWVLDVDLKDDGPAQLAALVDLNGPLPDTYIVDTASGGRHYYFRHVEGVRNRGKFAPGLDVRGEGGYVVAAHSVRDDGTFYDLVNDAEPADAPQWLLDLVVRRQHSAPVLPAASNDNAPYVDAAVAGEIEALVSTRAGRNNALNDAAFNLGTLVGAGVLGRGEAETRLYAAAVANGYFSVSRGKANLAPMSGAQEWRHLVSVPLGNGSGLTRPQDHAGVVTEWQWPSKDALLEAVSNDEMDRIFSEVDMADYRESEQAKDWVGHAVAFVLGVDVSEKAEKRRIKKLVTAWIEDGTLRIVEARDPLRRIAKKFVKSRNFKG